MFIIIFQKIKSKFLKICIFSILTISKGNATKIKTPNSVNPFQSPIAKNAPSCPPNAFCTGHIKELYGVWNNLVNKINNKKNEQQKINTLKNFHRKHGIIITLWAKEINKKRKLSLAVWDSPKREHHNSKEPIYQTQAFIRNTKNNKIRVMDSLRKVKFEIPNKNLFFRPILELSQGTIKKFYIPIEDIPSYFKNDQIVIFKEYEGIYFNLNISENGIWKIETPKKRSTLSIKKEDTNCPKKLISYFKSYYLPQNIYKKFYCKNIKDLKNHKKHTILIPWTY